MSVHLSPDGKYYWDGTKWASALSPDGAWRWDGSAWRPYAQQRPRRNRRVVALVGIVAIAVLLVAGAGAFVVTRVLSLEQSGLAGLGLVCKGKADPAGTPVSVGDTVCGYRLGSAELTASCSGAQIPDGTQAWQKGPSDAEPTSYGMPVDSEGCDLDAPSRTTIWLQTADSVSPDVIVVADYVPHTDWGAIGISLGCNGSTCLVFLIDPAGVYRVDEQRGPNDFRNVARGALPPFTISHLDQLNRMVVRYRDRNVEAFLNGYAVVRTTTGIVHTTGYVSVFEDDVGVADSALVHVRTLDVFSSK